MRTSRQHNKDYSRIQSMLLSIATIIITPHVALAQAKETHAYGQHTGPTDAEIVQQSQQRARDRQEAAEAARRNASDRREQELRDHRAKERQAQLDRYAQEQREAEIRQEQWREKQRQLEAEKKARDEERVERYRQQQEANRRVGEERKGRNAEK
jgi:colicin import membrane protein